jgi:hypothetical protein
VGNLGVADIRPIKEADQVQETELWRKLSAKDRPGRATRIARKGSYPWHQGPVKLP